MGDATFRTLAGLVVTLCALNFVTPSQAGTDRADRQAMAPAPAFEEAPCWFPATDKAGPHRCGIVRVPASRAPLRGQIALRVIVLQATGPQKLEDPVVFVPGGPGSSAVRNPTRWFNDQLRAHRDIVLFDPRGSWGSGEFCPGLAKVVAQTSTENLTLTEQSERMAAAARVCRNEVRSNGLDLADFKTSNIAQDLDDVRVAIGVPRWNVLSVSYGTTIALAYARMFPDRTRSLVLDSVSPMDPAWRSKGGENFNYAAGKLFERCAADRVCSADYPNLEQTFREALQGLEDPLWSPDSKAALNRQDFVMAVHRLLYGPDTIALTPFVIERVRARDGRIVVQLSQALNGSVTSHAYGAHWAIDCQGRGVPKNLSAAERGSFPLTSEYAAVCPELGLPNQDRAARAPRKSSVAALVIAGELDPITPRPVSEEAARIFPRGYFVVIPGHGHGPTGSSPCAAAIMRSFFDSPGIGPDLGCAVSQPIRFASPTIGAALLSGLGGDSPKPSR